MNIISTTNTSHPGDNRYIEESYTLAEQFGVYTVIRFGRISGWGAAAEVNVLITTTDQAEARKVYKEVILQAKN